MIAGELELQQIDSHCKFRAFLSGAAAAHGGGAILFGAAVLGEPNGVQLPTHELRFGKRITLATAPDVEGVQVST